MFYKNLSDYPNIELVRYLKAMRSTVITDDEIKNPSDLPLWFEKDGEVICVEPDTEQ